MKAYLSFLFLLLCRCCISRRRERSERCGSLPMHDYERVLTAGSALTTVAEQQNEVASLERRRLRSEFPLPLILLQQHEIAVSIRFVNAHIHLLSPGRHARCPILWHWNHCFRTADRMLRCAIVRGRTIAQVWVDLLLHRSSIRIC